MSIFNGIAGTRSEQSSTTMPEVRMQTHRIIRTGCQESIRKTDSHTIMCVQTERSMPRMIGTVPGIAAMAGETMSSILSRSARAWGT